VERLETFIDSLPPSDPLFRDLDAAKAHATHQRRTLSVARAKQLLHSELLGIDERSTESGPSAPAEGHTKWPDTEDDTERPDDDESLRSAIPLRHRSTYKSPVER